MGLSIGEGGGVLTFHSSIYCIIADPDGEIKLYMYVYVHVCNLLRVGLSRVHFCKFFKF